MAKDTFLLDQNSSLEMQIHFIKRFADAVMNDKESPFYGLITDENVDLLNDVAANLRIVLGTASTPALHQSTMHVLDKAVQLRATKNYEEVGNIRAFLSNVSGVIDLVVKQDFRTEEDLATELEWLASVALIGYAKFILPSRIKEVHNG